MKAPCQCPVCSLFAVLAFDLASIGDLEGAELAASQISWVNSGSEVEGYSDRWIPVAVAEIAESELN